MQMYEVRAIMKYEYYSHKDDWEQSRLIAYMIAQSNSKQHLSLSDIINFSWEKEDDDIEDSKISDEDMERLREQAKQYEKLINK